MVISGAAACSFNYEQAVYWECQNCKKCWRNEEDIETNKFRELTCDECQSHDIVKMRKSLPTIHTASKEVFDAIFRGTTHESGPPYDEHNDKPRN